MHVCHRIFVIVKKVHNLALISAVVFLIRRIFTFSKIQLVVYYQCCIVIG